MTTPRLDETWHRLLEWTNGQTPSERLAAQILLNQGFEELDPSHPLGGKDSGKDAVCRKNNKRFVMAVYFPRGQQSFATIRRKFLDDLHKARENSAEGFVFVTNQELRLVERKNLTAEWPTRVEIYHLERLTSILDSPAMFCVRKQFLGIDFFETDPPPLIIDGVNAEALGTFVKANDRGHVNPKWFHSGTLILGYGKGNERGPAEATFVLSLPSNVSRNLGEWRLSVIIETERIHGGLHSHIGPKQKKATIEINGKLLDEFYLIDRMPNGEDFGFRDVGPIVVDNAMLDSSIFHVTLKIEDQMAWDIDRVVLRMARGHL